MNLRVRLLVALISVLLIAVTAAPTATHAQERSAEESVADAAAWIASVPPESNNHFSAGSVADAVIALSAADQQPQAVIGLLDRLREIGPAYMHNNPGGHAKVLLAADTAGHSARFFLGPERDLIHELYEMLLPEPQASTLYWNPHIIAIALSRLGEPVPDFIIEHSSTHKKAVLSATILGATSFPTRTTPPSAFPR